MNFIEKSCFEEDHILSEKQLHFRRVFPKKKTQKYIRLMEKISVIVKTYSYYSHKINVKTKM